MNPVDDQPETKEQRMRRLLAQNAAAMGLRLCRKCSGELKKSRKRSLPEEWRWYCPACDTKQ